jgi:hypothetical protein
MTVDVILVAEDPKMLAAWRESFVENPEVTIVRGPMREQEVAAWVCPSDPELLAELGDDLARIVQTQLRTRYGTALPAGHAICAPTGIAVPRYVVATTAISGERDPLAIALAASAGLQSVHLANALAPRSIVSIALGPFTAGGLEPEICADVMWTAYDLFRNAQFRDFATMRLAVEQLLADVVPANGRHAYKRSSEPPSTRATNKPTLPDNAAAQAQLKKKLESAIKDE